MSDLPQAQTQMTDEVKAFAAELRKWWRFDSWQLHTHSWHDREDFISKKLPLLLASARKAGMEEAAKIAEEAARFDAGMLTDQVTRASRAGSIAAAIRSAAKAPHK